MKNNQTDAAIEFALSLNGSEGIDFLGLWRAGEFDLCRKNWPEAPESCYVGADQLQIESFFESIKPTRVSVDEDDPGFNSLFGSVKDGIKVFLDGRPIKHAFTADSVEGFIECAVEKDGMFVVEGEDFARQTLTGNVRIEFSDKLKSIMVAEFKEKTV